MHGFSEALTSASACIEAQRQLQVICCIAWHDPPETVTVSMCSDPLMFSCRDLCAGKCQPLAAGKGQQQAALMPTSNQSQTIMVNTVLENSAGKIILQPKKASQHIKILKEWPKLL